MEFVITRDNSVTLFSEKYKEHFHSLSGALEEAQKKYVEAVGIENGYVLLDICFGLGYNSFAALNSAEALTIFALENDSRILKKISDVPLSGKYDIIKTFAETGQYNDKNYKLFLFLGDALETINNVPPNVDRVFLDPFSPKKCPELWTAPFFQKIFEKMKHGAKLATYSCARIVRQNLRDVGFLVYDGPCIGRWAPSTIAIKP